MSSKWLNTHDKSSKMLFNCLNRKELQKGKCNLCFDDNYKNSQMMYNEEWFTYWVKIAQRQKKFNAYPSKGKYTGLNVYPEWSVT